MKDDEHSKNLWFKCDYVYSFLEDLGQSLLV